MVLGKDHLAVKKTCSLMGWDKILLLLPGYCFKYLFVAGLIIIDTSFFF